MARNYFNFETKQEWLEQRAKNINSTDVSALFGLSKYMTPYELFHKKKNKTTDEISNPRMIYGTMLESGILNLFNHLENKEAIPMKAYCELDDLKIGSSFDAVIESENAIVEIKNVDQFIFKNEWIDDEAPYHIELQVQHQMLVSGYSNCYLVALVGGNDLKVFKRTADENIQQAIIEKVKEFWSAIENGIEPEIDYAKDYEFVKSLYQETDGSVIVTDDLYPLARKYKDYSTMEAEAKEQKEAIKAEIFTKIGQTEKVKGSNYSISASVVNKAEYLVKPQSYRNLRTTVKG